MRFGHIIVTEGSSLKAVNEATSPITQRQTHGCSSSATQIGFSPKDGLPTKWRDILLTDEGEHPDHTEFSNRFLHKMGLPKFSPDLLEDNPSLVTRRMEMMAEYVAEKELAGRKIERINLVA